MTSTGSGDSELYFATASNGRGIYLDQSDANKLKIYDGSGKGTAGEVVIDNTGQVGIGISPRAKLDVYQQTNRTSLTGTARGVLHLQDGDTAANNEITAITFESNSNNAVSIIGQKLTNSGSFLFFGTSNNYSAGVTNTAMTINHLGNVGIGTDNPQAKLNISGSSENIRLDNTGTGNYGLEIWRGGNKGASFAWGEGNANLEIKNYRNDSQADGPYANIDFFTGGTNATSGGSPAYSPTRRMRIQQTGEVGIGVDNPTAALEINRGSAPYGMILGSTQGAGRVMLFKDNHASPSKYNWLVGSQFNVNNAFEITPSTVVGGFTFNAGAGITILETGNVGINNTECSHKLQIEENGTGAITSLRLANENTSVGDGSQLLFTSGTSTVGAAIAGYGTALNKADLIFKAGGDTERMRITDGNVGIGAGATSPETELHVKGSNNSAGDLYTQVGPGNCPSITIQNAGTTNNNNAALYFRDDQDMRGSINMRFVNHSTHASELRFATTQANNTREKFVMTAAGQLGINKMSGFDSGGFGTPMLVIKQVVNSAWGGINVEANGNDSIFAISCLDSGATLNTSYRTGAGHKPLTMQCAGQDGIQIGTSGNVRIGSGNVASNGQTHQLHVDSGTVGYGLKVHSNTGYGLQGSNNTGYYHHDTDRGMYYWDTACYASGGFHTYSDSRLKENVTAITGALDSVAKMNGVTFTWDNSEKVRGPNGKQFGVLAQNMLEVDSALPTLNVDPLEEQDNIDNDSKDTDYYSMDYSRLTPYFIEAIKELKTKLEAAEARIATLEG